MIRHQIFVGVGANLSGPAGPPAATISRARQLLARRGVHVVRSSRLFASEPQGGVRQPVFLNAVWQVQTPLCPSRLLETLLWTETTLGRRRKVRWGPRTIDLDLLAYGKVTAGGADTSALQLPHPRLGERGFVLWPLADVAPRWPVPAALGGPAARSPGAAARLLGMAVRAGVRPLR